MTPAKPKRDPEDLEQLPLEEAQRRMDELLRRMLNTPPDPYTPKPKKAKKSTKPAK